VSAVNTLLGCTRFRTVERELQAIAFAHRNDTQREVPRGSTVDTTGHCRCDHRADPAALVDPATENQLVILLHV
jgi:hypothetical protein